MHVAPEGDGGGKSSARMGIWLLPMVPSGARLREWDWWRVEDSTPTQTSPRLWTCFDLKTIVVSFMLK